jgi:hypothetical protein
MFRNYVFRKPGIPTHTHTHTHTHIYMYVCIYMYIYIYVYIYVYIDILLRYFKQWWRQNLKVFKKEINRTTFMIRYNIISYISYHIISYYIISYHIFVNCNWVDTQWQNTVHIYAQTLHRKTQLTNWKECGPCPVFARYTLAFALQLRKKHGKTSVRIAEECQLARRFRT